MKRNSELNHTLLTQIAHKTGTPVYVYSSKALSGALKDFQAGLSQVNSLVCFAMKSNSNLAILRLLGKSGAGMDVVSGGELYRARKAGIAANRIVFSGVGKTAAEMSYALEQGILCFNIESIGELTALSSVAKNLGKKAPISLRFNPDVNPRTHPYIATGLKKNKFGMTRSEILKLIKTLSSMKSIELRGLSMHMGSQILSLDPFRDGFKKARELLDEIEATTPHRFTLMDLGGGLGVPYKNEKNPSIKEYCELILKIFGPQSWRKTPPKILIEPGRSISGNAGILLTQVLYRKKRTTKDILIVDAAMNDLIRPALYGSYHEILPLNPARLRGPQKKTDVVGPICESADCFASEKLFPTRVNPGDLLAIHSAGAYGFSMSSNYNSRPRPAEVLVENGKFRLIRERESWEDLVRGERI